MTIQEFLTEAIDEYGAKPTKARLARLRRYLEKFDEDQVQQLFDQVTQNAKIFPRVAHVKEQAQELGFLATPARASKVYTWRKTDCQLCKGEGRLRVFMEHYSVEGEEGLEKKARVVAVMGLSETTRDPQLEEAKKPREERRTIYSYFFRCCCPEGERINRKIPRWRDSTTYTPPPGRQPKTQEPTQAEMKAVKDVLAGARQEEQRPDWRRRAAGDDDDIPF